MKQLLFIFIFISQLLFATSAEKSYYIFHHDTAGYLSKQAFLYKMGNYSVQPGYHHFLQVLSNEYFTTPLKTLVPLKLPDADTSNPEFVKLPRYGEGISSYMGVWQKANDKGMAKHYQCSELVHRFYKRVFGTSHIVQRNGVVTAKEYDGVVGRYNDHLVKIVYYPLTNANLVVKPRASLALEKIYDIHRRGDNYFYNTSFNSTFEKDPPINGSILSFANNFHSQSGVYFGHTAIVKKVEKIKNGYRVYCFEQNVIQSKKDAISLNRYITFVKIKGQWQEIGSGVLGDEIGRIGPVIGWSNPYFIKHIDIIDRANFHTLITKLIDSKYLRLVKYTASIVKPITQNIALDNYVRKSLYNAVIQQMTLANSIKHESFFHKILKKFDL